MAGISALHVAALSLPSGADLISLLRKTEILEEGLRRLYNATVEHQCFPGDLLETEEDEVSTTDILEALELVQRHKKRLPGRHSQNPLSVAAPLSESIGSEPQGRHRLSRNLFKASTATCQSQAMAPTKDISRSASPMVAGDMCTQFFAVVGHSQRISMPQPSLLADSTQSQARTSENAFFDFDRYNQAKMASMMQLQQETQGCKLSSPANILSIPADQNAGPIPDNQLHINPASSSNPLTINLDPSDCFEDGIPANLFGFPPPSTTPQ